MKMSLSSVASPFPLTWTILLLATMVTVNAGGDDDSKTSSWYTKYDEYPEYCSIPSEMETRKIPELNVDNSHLGETRLVHTTAIIRHGARTPYSSGYQCWEGFWTSPDTGIWDCDLTTILAPPTPSEVWQEEGYKQYHAPNTGEMTTANAMFLFEKIYDALKDPLHNELNGTCQLGQLLLQGYEQELQNGKFLRDAYLYDSTDASHNHDIRMRLVDTSLKQYIPWDKSILRYRSDDDQRTVMSGQILLRGLFGPEVIKDFEKFKTYPTIPVHTADRHRDIVDPNEGVCPKLVDLRQEAEQSDVYQQFNTSVRSKAIRKYMVDDLGQVIGHDALLDCLMTTMCTDRQLPDAINDYNSSNPKSWFTTLMEYNIMDYNLRIKYNDAAYAKLGMAPLWAEVMENINDILGLDDRERPAPKLAIFSGHDTTIMPMLASLDPSMLPDKHWAPYASMMIIELHELVDGRTDRNMYTSSHVFRLLYNGKVMTSMLPGCPENSQLCDVKILTDRVEPFATRSLDCTASEQPSHPVLNEAKSVLSTTIGVIAFLGLVFTSASIGGIITFIYLTGYLPTGHKVVSRTNGHRGLNNTSTTTNNGFNDNEDDDFNDEH